MRGLQAQPRPAREDVLYAFSPTQSQQVRRVQDFENSEIQPQTLAAGEDLALLDCWTYLEVLGEPSRPDAGLLSTLFRPHLGTDRGMARCWLRWLRRHENQSPESLALFHSSSELPQKPLPVAEALGTQAFATLAAVQATSLSGSKACLKP